MPIDERKDKDTTKLPDAKREDELKDLSAKKVDEKEEENVKGGFLGGIVRSGSEQV